MGEYTTSYTWKGYRKSEATRLIAHDARDVEEEQGKVRSHSNQLIRPEWTARNVTLMNDGAGNLVPMTSVEDAHAYMEKLLGELQNTRTLKDGRVVKVKHREDANALVGFVLQLDPRMTRDPSKSDEWYDALTDAEYKALPPDIATMSDEKIEETEHYLQVMLDEVIERMGVENIVSVSTHWDESHPHIQVYAVPAVDGKLSYTKKFGGGSKEASQQLYREAHDRMRQRLIEAGYDATMDRLARRPHEALRDFKARRKRERDVHEQERKAEEHSRWTADFAHEVMSFADELDDREARLVEREAEVEAARQAVSKEAEQARKRGYAEGVKQGKQEGMAQAKQEVAEEVEKARLARKEAEEERKAVQAEGRAQGLPEGRQSVDEHIARLRAEWTTLRGLEGGLDDAIRDVRKQVPTAEQARQMIQETVRSDAPHLIYAFLTQRDMRLKEQGKEPGWVRSFERFAEQRLGKNWREKWTQETQTHASAIENAERRRQEIKYEVEQADETRPNDGMSL